MPRRTPDYDHMSAAELRAAAAQFVSEGNDPPIRVSFASQEGFHRSRLSFKSGHVMFFVPTDGEVAESLGLHRLELTIEKPRATFDLTVLVQWRRHRPSTNRFGVPMATGFAVDVVPRRRDAERLLRYVEEVDVRRRLNPR